MVKSALGHRWLRRSVGPLVGITAVLRLANAGLSRPALVERQGTAWHANGTRGVGVAFLKPLTADVGVPTIENAFGLLRQMLNVAVEDAHIPRKSA